jgi:hypothetical protein
MCINISPTMSVRLNFQVCLVIYLSDYSPCPHPYYLQLSGFIPRNPLFVSYPSLDIIRAPNLHVLGFLPILNHSKSRDSLPLMRLSLYALYDKPFEFCYRQILESNRVWSSSISISFCPCKSSN